MPLFCVKSQDGNFFQALALGHVRPFAIRASHFLWLMTRITPQYHLRMRYVLFRAKGASTAALRVGALAADGQHVADISAYLGSTGKPSLSSMRQFLEMGAEANSAAATAALGNAQFHVSLAELDLRAPIYDWCVSKSFNNSVGPHILTSDCLAARRYCALA